MVLYVVIAMADILEQNFANITVSVKALRDYFDLNDGEFCFPDNLQGREELIEDLRTALSAASRNGDPENLSGREIVEEVNDDDSPYHGRSAFQIMARVAGIEHILKLSGSQSRFLCLNESIEGLHTGTQSLRNSSFLEGAYKIDEIIPETIKDRVAVTLALRTALESAEYDGHLSLLSGIEVLTGLEEDGNILSCDNFSAFDIFWVMSLTNSWVKGASTVEYIEGDGVLDLADAANPQAAGLARGSARVAAQPGSDLRGLDLLTQDPAKPGAPRTLFDDTTQLARDLSGGTADIGLAGGGLYIQRGVVEEFRMVFKEVTDAGKSRLVLSEVDRIPRLAGMQPEPISPAEFMRQHKRIYEQGLDEARLLLERAKSATVAGAAREPATFVRTAVRRGWIRGAISPRRIAGWGMTAAGVADLALRIFRDDGQGLDGPLTDAGMDPIDARISVLTGEAGIMFAILTFAGPEGWIGIALMALGIGGISYDMFDTAKEAFYGPEYETEELHEEPKEEIPPYNTPQKFPEPEWNGPNDAPLISSPSEMGENHVFAANTFPEP